MEVGAFCSLRAPVTTLTTEPTLNDAGWTLACPVTVRGTWAYEYRPTDLAGLVEETRTVVVHIGAKPRLTSLNPLSGRRGSTLTLNGSNFGGTCGASYVMNGARKVASSPSWSKTRVKVRVPSMAVFGSQKVKLVTKVGTGNTCSFTVKR
mgnify:CR=1 FL=1